MNKSLKRYEKSSPELDNNVRFESKDSALFPLEVVYWNGLSARQAITDNYFIDFCKGNNCLFVTFEPFGDILARPDGSRKPWGLDFLKKRGFSIIGVKPKQVDWYRKADLHAFFRSAAFIEFIGGFEKVVFYGGSMGGFAALTFADVAPGCIVIAHNPQTTLDPTKVPWESRFPVGSAEDWSGDFADAAIGAQKASKVFVSYDPFDALDRRHVELLDNSNLVPLKVPLLGHQMPVWFQKMGLLSVVVDNSLTNEIDENSWFLLLKRRRTLARYYVQLSKKMRIRHKQEEMLQHALACDEKDTDAILALRKLKQTKPFDVAISLGSNCQARYNISRTVWFRRYHTFDGFFLANNAGSGGDWGTFLFDWSFLPNCKGVIKLLTHDLVGSFSEGIEIKKQPDGGQAVVDLFSGLQYPHQFAGTLEGTATLDSVNAELLLMQEKYTYLAEKTRRALDDSEHVLFIRCGNVSDQELMELLSILKKRVKSFLLLYVPWTDAETNITNELQDECLLIRPCQFKEYPGDVNAWADIFADLAFTLPEASPVKSVENEFRRSVKSISIEILPLQNKLHLENFANNVNASLNRLDLKKGQLSLKFQLVVLFSDAQIQRFWLTDTDASDKIQLLPQNVESPYMGQKHVNIAWSNKSRFVIDETVLLPDTFVTQSSLNLLAEVNGEYRNIGVIQVASSQEVD
jgi:hypothetical protein